MTAPISAPVTPTTIAKDYVQSKQFNTPSRNSAKLSHASKVDSLDRNKPSSDLRTPQEKAKAIEHLREESAATAAKISGNAAATSFTSTGNFAV